MTMFLTLFQEEYDFVTVHGVQPAHQVHSRCAPIDPVHPFTTEALLRILDIDHIEHRVYQYLLISIC